MAAAHAPGVSVLDRAQRLLYVTLAGATSIAKISLDSAGVQLIDVPAPAISLALGAEDIVFARLDDGFGFDAPISIIDAAEGSVQRGRHHAQLGDDRYPGRQALSGATLAGLAGQT